MGFGLMILMLIGFMIYQTKQAQEHQLAEQQRLDSLAKVESTLPKVEDTLTEIKTAPLEQSEELSDSLKQELRNSQAFQNYGIFANASNGVAKEVVLQNDKVKLTLSTKGGMFTKAELIDGEYKDYHHQENIRLWDDSLSSMKLAFNLQGKGSFSGDHFYFEPSASLVDASTTAGQLTMKLNTDNPAQYLEIIYTLQPDKYNVDVHINTSGLSNELQLAAQPMRFEWKAVGYSNEKGISAERSRSSVFYREMTKDRDYLSETKSDSEITAKPLNWVAFKQNYFSAAVISGSGFSAGSELKIDLAEDSTHTKYYGATLILPTPQAGSATSTPLTFYFGPNDFKILKAMDVEEFDRIIDYGWSIIGTVNRYIVRPLFWFFSSFIGSWGLIILLVTLVIKTVLFPVTWKNYLSSAKMRVLKPEIEEINKRFEGKDDAVGKQQATMALYRETGVNPFAGCIPVMLQMPILYAMFRYFPAEIALRGKSFLWADDLAAFDVIFSWSQHIPILSSIYGNHISGFTLLMAASTFVYSQMNMGAQPQMVQQPGMPNMKVMMHLFTVMMIFFFNNQPAGLTLYYFIANIVSISQMLVIKKYFIDEDAIRAKIEKNKTKPKKSKSGFMQRLEEAQKMQRQKLEQQQGKKRR